MAQAAKGIGARLIFPCSDYASGGDPFVTFESQDITNPGSSCRDRRQRPERDFGSGRKAVQSPVLTEHEIRSSHALPFHEPPRQGH